MTSPTKFDTLRELYYMRGGEKLTARLLDGGARVELYWSCGALLPTSPQDLTRSESAMMDDIARAMGYTLLDNDNTTSTKRVYVAVNPNYTPL